MGMWWVGKEPSQTAKDFPTALEGDFAGAFSRVIFALPDGSEQRPCLHLFSEVFSEE